MQRTLEAQSLGSVQLRPFTAEDYPAFAELYGRLYPSAPKSEAELRYADGRFERPYLHKRWVAAGERLVGWADYAQHAAFDPPGQFALELGLLPEFTTLRPWLYERLMEKVQAHRPRALRTEVADAEFYLERGFREVKRNVTLQLELSAFDEDRFAARMGAVGVQGYSFVTFAELERIDEGLHALFELLRVLVTDVPSAVPRTPWSYEQFSAHRRSSPVLFPEASVVVRHDEELVGVSELKRTNDPKQLMTSLTAVKRAHRGRGVALAAKGRALQYARDCGFETVVTQNASSNAGMLTVNERLGFEPVRTHLELHKTL